MSTVEQDIRDKFKRSGYTLTSQRRAVLDALKDSEGHPSAEEIYLSVKRRNPRVALGTVYQALSVLERIGVIETKHWSDSPTRYDLNTAPHYDIRCTRCGRVDEIPEVELGDIGSHLQARTPYEVSSVSVVVEGLCPTCRS